VIAEENALAGRRNWFELEREWLRWLEATH
jgi:hypothetical protein